MKDEGYTLVETLVALVVLSMAIGGVVTGIEVISRQQHDIAGRVAETEARRAGQVAMERLLEEQGPFRSDQPERFAGSGGGMQFDCGQDQPCQALLIDAGDLVLQLTEHGRARRLALKARGSAHFVYESEFGTSTTWPPAVNVRQHLRAVAIIRDGDPPPSGLLKARVWREQSLDCQFDVVMQDCR